MPAKGWEAPPAPTATNYPCANMTAVRSGSLARLLDIVKERNTDSEQSYTGWHCCGDQASGMWLQWPEVKLQVGTVNLRTSPSEGTSVTHSPRVTNSVHFLREAGNPYFMWNFSIFKHSVGQTKHSHRFWPPLYNRECLLLFLQTNECSIKRRNLEVSVRLCSSMGCRLYPKPLRY